MLLLSVTTMSGLALFSISVIAMLVGVPPNVVLTAVSKLRVPKVGEDRRAHHHLAAGVCDDDSDGAFGAGPGGQGDDDGGAGHGLHRCALPVDGDKRAA